MIKGCKYIVFFFIVTVAQVTYTQNYINYNENNGLPSNHIYRITQDKKGFIWIGTDKGLVKYNGKKFTTFTTANGLQSNSVWELFPTPDGKLWFASKTSKIGYIKNDSVHIFPSNVKNDVFNPIYTSVIGDSVFPNGPNKSYTFDVKNKRWKKKNDIINDKNKAGRIYIKHKKWDVLYSLDNKNFSLINTCKKDTFHLKISVDVTFYNRHQITDSLFFLLHQKKYVVINLNTKQVHEKELKKEVGIAFSRNICVNYVNNEIQISGNGFVGKLDKDYGLSGVAYIDENLNPNNTFIDKQNTLWIASFSNGVYKLSKMAQKSIHTFPKNGITKLRKVNNQIIALIQKKGFYKYNETEKQFTPYLKSNSFLFNAISNFKTNYYLNAKSTRIENEKGKIKQLKYSEDISGYLRSLIYFNNYFYAHSGFGVLKVDIKKDSVRLVKEYSQIGTNYIALFKNCIVVATNSGLKQIKNDSLVATEVAYTKKIKCLFTLSKNQLLVTTDGDGAFITDLTLIKQIPETRGLIVSDAYKDTNTLWLATNKGVQEYKIKNNTYSLIRTIDKRYGLPTDKINSVITTKNRILIATNLGIIDLPLKKLWELEQLDVYVKNIFFNKQKLKEYGKVTYKKNNMVEVEMGIIDFSENTNPTQYNYKLEPIHKKWQSTTTSKLNFNNLPPNDYRLLVKVKNITKSMSFTIKPQWYQTGFFYLLASALFLTSIVFTTVYISRITQKRKNQKLLQLKKISELELKALRSQMNPHFVFNSLTAIQYYINQNDFESSDRYLVKFSRLIRDFFELSKEQTISVEREKDLLTTYLDLEKMRFKGKLSYQIKVQPKLDVKTEIPTMLLQPVVENAINHGIFNKQGNGCIKIDFQKINKNTLSVTISDDGVGVKRTRKDEKRFKSTSVLTDRIQFLNETKKWKINVKRENLYEDKKDKGYVVTFVIINDSLS